MGTISRCFLVGLALVFALSMVGCGSGTAGGGGGGGETGGTTTRVVAQSFDEQCAFCHGSGTSLDVTDQTVGMPHSIATGSPQVTFTAVREVNVTVAPPDDRLEVDFRITDSVTGALETGIPALNIRFALAKLIPAAALTGDASMWQSYINTTRTATAGTFVRATNERVDAAGGIFTDFGNGTYRYRFSFNMNTVTLPSPPSGAPVAYDRTATHRIASQVSDLTGKNNVNNGFVDFVPNAPGFSLGPVFPAPAVNRKIATNGSPDTISCNSCHKRLGFHGGGRISVEYCVTCHNPGSTDSESGNTVDLKVMAHKIHMGENLPSVVAGGSYSISSANYNTVVYPQDIRNCTKCHSNTPTNPATPQGDNWKNVPTMQACGSCHDRTSFAAVPPAGFTPHSGGPQADNSQCADCHGPGETISVENVHAIPEQLAATGATAKFKYNILSVTNTAPGQFPTVRFSVTNPSAGNAPYIIYPPAAAAPEWKAPGGASRLAILIGWPTTDYTNTGSSVTPAQPISINPLAGAVNNGDNTFTVASTVPIPAGVTGSGTVAIEGHPAVQSVPGGAYDLRVPVTGVVQSFAIPPAVLQNRRTVVDIAKCNQCHGLLSLHGGNRNNNTQLCVICHNANATDLNRRPVPGPGVDGKAEEAIDFKSMIHGIHAAKAGTGFDGFRTNGLVVYGFGGATDFSDVRMPTGAGGSGVNKNLNIKNCLGCHIAGTFGSPINANALPTTIDTGTDKSSPDDDTNITPMASVCSSCHDDTASKTHMTANGGRFDYKAFITVVEGGGGGGGGGTDQVALCGPGPVSAQPAGHTTRTDCCSCHSPR